MIQQVWPFLCHVTGNSHRVRKMRRRAQTPETVGNSGLVLVLVGSVLVGLLMWLLHLGWGGSLVLSFVVVAAPVAVSLAWIWSRMR